MIVFVFIVALCAIIYSLWRSSDYYQKKNQQQSFKQGEYNSVSESTYTRKGFEPGEIQLEGTKKWFQKLIIICILFCFSFLIVPLIIAIKKLIDFRREYNPIINKCIDLEAAENKLSFKQKELEKMIDEKTAKINDLDSQYETKSSQHEAALKSLEKDSEKDLKELEEKYQQEKARWEQDIKTLNIEHQLLTQDTLIAHYNFTDYDGLTSEECKNQISLLQVKEQELIRNGKAVKTEYRESKKAQNNNVKQIIRCFNAECNNILMDISSKNIDSMRSKTSRAYESLNRIFEVDGVALAPEMLGWKLEELNLAYTYEVKREQEKELQKEIKAQMLEEEKVRREIEREKKKIEKDQTQLTNEINRLMTYLQKTANDIEKQLYIDKINGLEDKLEELEAHKADVLEREANARAGHVYIISNIGSFGEDIYKIGMTRRLEPMDRIKELSSASVPFEFDVHAMIFSENAPELENLLHKHFEKESVNKINPRKEFFNVSIDEIERVTKEKYNNTVEFTKIPLAREYHQTLELKSNAS